MALVDFSFLTTSFDASNYNTTNQVAAPTQSAFALSWVADIGSHQYSFTAISSSGNIAGSPPSGTIDSIAVSWKLTAGTYAPAFSITGLSVALSGLIDTVTPSNTAEKFWETAMAGASTIVLSKTNDVTIFGDFYEVESNPTGSADTFITPATTIAPGGVAVGDAYQVLAGKTLTGGADTFTNVRNGTIFGDAYLVGGSLTGAADQFTFSFSASFVNPVTIGFVLGDFGIVQPNAGAIIGGADVFTLTNVFQASDILGDGNLVDKAKILKGGADKVTAILSSNFPAPGTISKIVGDVDTVVGVTDAIASTTSDVLGGNDTLFVRNYNVNNLSGDFQQVQFGLTAGQTAVGGNDAITFSNTMISIMPPSAPPPIAVNQIVGDVSALASSTTATFTGGADVIKLTGTIFVGLVSGDTASASGNQLRFIGGSDSISYSSASDTVPFSSLFSGDAVIFTGRTFVAGHDTISISAKQVAGGVIYGDSGSISLQANGLFRGGHDIISMTDQISGGVQIFGDAQSATAVSGILTGGNDTISGSSGNDTIFADTKAPTGFTTVTGGRDIVDGRGGNDVMDGGLNTDTLVFSLAQSVFVDLAGIAGSNAADPLNPYEAIGQGFDQAANFENVIGSSFDDIIIGNNQLNTLDGSAGNDRLDGGADALIDILKGGAGNDIYAMSNRVDNIIDASGVDTMLSTITRNISSANFLEVERLVLEGTANINGTGNALVNILTGNTGSNVLTEVTGNDTLIGNNGQDTLVGGAGADRLAGGRLTAVEITAARDTFKYNAAAESGITVATADSIFFFDKGTAATDDRINLALVDGNTAAAGNQNFVFRGAAAFSQAGGEVRLQIVGADTHVQIDTDADSAVEMLIVVKGVTGLLASDFILA